jgi:hypothetical protein
MTGILYALQNVVAHPCELLQLVSELPEHVPAHVVALHSKQK